MTRRLTLIVVGEERAPVELPQQGRLVIGSGERAHLQLIGQGVADVHCTIGRVKGGGWALQDLGSAFGTLVNGAPAATHRLEAGDELLIGSRKLRVVDPLQPERASAAAPATPAVQRPSPAPAPAPAPAAIPAPGPAPVASRPAPIPRATELPDTERLPTLGGYRIEDRLGRGAMGSVYLARQTSLDRPVALKVLSPELAGDPHFVERFQAEARAAAALNHPNVVTVYDVGTDAGHHYLAMEYMDAGSLEARLAERGPLPWREVLDALRDAAAGLVYAEQRRIVHRDIKPENLMRNRDGVTKIADLGLAVQIEAESQDDDHVSEGRRIFGTPHFIAPEVVRGGAADSRSDLYSLGATAYRLLSGHTPFEGASTREILRGVLNDPAPPLAERVPGLPAGVARLVHRLLEKEPAARFASAQVTLDELERLRRGEGLNAAPAGSRSKAPFAIGAAVAVALGFGALQLLGGGDGPPPQPSRGQDTTGAGQAATGAGAAGTSEGEVAQPGPAGATAPGTAQGAADAAAQPSEKEFELRAQVAYLQLRDRVLSDDERLAALAALAAEYAGTDIARTATAEREALMAARAEAARSASAKSTRRETVLGALRFAAGGGEAAGTAAEFNAAAALRAMLAVPGLAEANTELAGDGEYVAGRLAAVEGVLTTAAEAGRKLLADAEAAGLAGDFARMGACLAAVPRVTELPPLAELTPLVGDRTPEGLGTLQALAGEAQRQLDGIDARKAELTARAAREARQQAAAALGRGIGLERDLRAGALEAAAERLERAATGLDSSLAAEASALATDLRTAQRLLATLGTGFATPGWKRRSFSDPRSAATRPTTTEAIGADAAGLLVDAGGREERLPWSLFLAQPKAVDSLVSGRLNREYSADERRGHVTLLRIAAVLAALDEAIEVLVPGSTARFSPGEGAALLANYEPLSAAVVGVGDGAFAAAISGERAAAEALVLALRARSDNEWSRATAAFERLLRDHSGSLLVLLLSDGTTE